MVKTYNDNEVLFSFPAENNNNTIHYYGCILLNTAEPSLNLPPPNAERIVEETVLEDKLVTTITYDQIQRMRRLQQAFSINDFNSCIATDDNDVTSI